MACNKTIRQVAADARQGIVGGIAYTLVGLIALPAIGLIGGNVPAWTLAGAALVVVGPCAFLISGLIREIDRRGGDLAEASWRAEGAEREQALHLQQFDQQTRGEVAFSRAARNFPSPNPRAPRERQGNLKRRTLANQVEVDILDSVDRCGRGSTGLPNLATTLNQLEALATEFGQLVAGAEQIKSALTSA